MNKNRRLYILTHEYPIHKKYIYIYIYIYIRNQNYKNEFNN